MVVHICKKGFRITKKKIIGYFNKFKHIRDNCIVVSFGENCLTDDILSRNGLKTFSSPYSAGRSNIEYILCYEKENFRDFLNEQYLKYEIVDGKQVPRNKKYVVTKNSYHESCSHGFEFTHHDVIAKKKVRNIIYKRCRRMLRKCDKNLIIVYHHRYCNNTDKELLISHLLELKEIYSKRYNEVFIYLFSQRIVTESDCRKVEFFSNKGIREFIFNTFNEWAGKNDDIFWARCDDDLIKEMVDDIKGIINETDKLL